MAKPLVGVALMLFITGILTLFLGTPFLPEFWKYVQFAVGVTISLVGIGLYAVYAVRVLYQRFSSEEPVTVSEEEVQ